MTSPTEQRRAFDAAMEAYRSGDMARARIAFTGVTRENPGMSDAWLGRMACGDHELETLTGAHENSRALYRETRRIGLNDGDLYAQIAAPLYVTVPVWSRATIGLAYAAALIAARRYDDAVTLVDDPIITADSQAAQWHQFITACLFHQTRRWPDVRSATAVCPPATATDVLDQVSIAVASMSAPAAASLGQFQAALELTDRLAPDNGYVAADIALTRGWCLRELGDEEGARASFQGGGGRATDGAGPPGAGQPELPAHRHRCRHHRHPRRSVGSGHRGVAVVAGRCRVGP